MTTTNDDENDERTPLLVPEVIPKRTPLPWAQLSIIIFLQLSEPLASQLVNPIAPQLIRETGITGGDETRVGYFVGILQSSFFGAQALTVLHWSRLSDHIGRKPVLISGLCGISIAMFSFGLSKNYWNLVASRSVQGALNGNIGVMKSMMADITDSTNVAAAFSFLPIAWGTGSTLGPLLGAVFAHPYERFPGTIFSKLAFFKQYPYFLACSVPAIYALIALTVTSLYLKETVHTSFSMKRLLRLSSSKSDRDPESPSTLKRTPILEEEYKPPPPLLAILRSPRVQLSTLNYALLSLLDIGFRSVIPVFYSTPSDLGGLALSPQLIGGLLSAFGLFNGIMQVGFFAKIHNLKWMGTWRMYHICLLFGAFPAILCFPVMSVLMRKGYGTASDGGLTPLVWAMVGVQLGLSMLLSMSFSCVFIYVAASSPTRSSIGATNGIAQVTVSVVRTIGPGLVNSLFSVSIEKIREGKYLGGYVVWLVLLVLLAMAVAGGWMMPRKVWKREGEA